MIDTGETRLSPNEAANRAWAVTDNVLRSQRAHYGRLLDERGFDGQEELIQRLDAALGALRRVGSLRATGCYAVPRPELLEAVSSALDTAVLAQSLTAKVDMVTVEGDIWDARTT